MNCRTTNTDVINHRTTDIEIQVGHGIMTEQHNGQQEKQHLTTAQLSTLLDGQLPVEEREFSDAHLATCEQCQQELESLRQTKMLLHAMPRPVLPRSFTLPVSTQQADTSTIPAPITPITEYRSTPRRVRSRPYYARTALRTIGTLAAMVGLVLLLSSLIPFVTQRGGGTAQNGTSTTSPETRQATPWGPLSPNLRGTSVIQPTTQPQKTQTTQPTASSGTFLPSLLDINTLEGRSFYGAFLFLLGIIALMLGRRREPHRGP